MIFILLNYAYIEDETLIKPQQQTAQNALKQMGGIHEVKSLTSPLGVDSIQADSYLNLFSV